MSRYSFDELVKDVAEVGDCKGHAYQSWLEYGVVGFDGGLDTYFLQLEVNDQLVWWFGRTPKEIDSPYQLLAIIARLFDIETSVEYHQGIVDELIKDRAEHVAQSYQQDDIGAVLKHYEIRDDYWGKHCGAFKVGENEDASSFPSPSSFRDGYIEQGYKPYGEAEGYDDD